MTRRKPISLYIALVLTIVSIACVTWGIGILRIVPSILLVFILPGYTILAAWFPDRLADVTTGVLFTLALSIASVAIGGVLLNILPWGLNTQSWAFWLGSIALINSMISLQRRRYRYKPAPADKFFGFRFRHAALMLTATLMLFGAFVFARQGVLDQPRPGFTQLWITQADEVNGFRVGVQNEEDQSIRYRLVILGTEGIAQNNISLEPGARWEMPFQLDNLPTLKLEALLYRMDDPETVYRSVTLWLTDRE